MGKNPDKSRIFHLPGTNWLKPGQNPDISEKPPGQGPKKRTCPGKSGRMVSLNSLIFKARKSIGRCRQMKCCHPPSGEWMEETKLNCSSSQHLSRQREIHLQRNL